MNEPNPAPNPGNAGQPPKRVLLFEEKAHLCIGHFPHWIGQLSSALAEEGHEVEVLTRNGWALEAEGRTLEGVANLHRMPRHHRLLLKASERGRLILPSMRLDSFGGLLSWILGAFEQAIFVYTIRHRIRKLGGQLNTVVIVLSMTLRATWAALLAPLNAQWIVYEHHPPDSKTSSGPVWYLRKLASRRQRRRLERGGTVSVAANNAQAAAGWRGRYPWLPCAVVPAAGRLPVEPARKAEARGLLKLDKTGRVALHFGFAHAAKDLGTIFSAFSSDDPDLGHLVLAGIGVDSQFSEWRAAHPAASVSMMTVIDGYISEEQKHNLYSAADYVALSFRAGTAPDSGTLSDSVAYALPVCCSDTGETGEMVREFKLGVVFAPGDSSSLRLAAKSLANFRLDAGARALYFEARSPALLARRLVELAENPEAVYVEGYAGG